MLGLASSGAHSNGYSLIRRIIGTRRDDLAADFGGRTLGQALLEPTRIYVKSVLQLIEKIPVKGLAHITGGGLVENVPRILSEHLSARLERASWPQPPLYAWLQQHGKISDDEMLRVFNCGIGMVAIVAEQRRCRSAAAARRGRNRVAHRSVQPRRGEAQTTSHEKIVILISGRGSNMQALLAADCRSRSGSNQ